jgi:hypothetical protein
MNIKKILKDIDDYYRQKATEYPEMELGEMESIFNILSVGFLFGHPLVPIHISLELLKDIEPESIIMSINKTSLTSHPLSYLFSSFDIG